MADNHGSPRVELVTFNCKECYIYKIPPASTSGHRAELWDVDHWLQEVTLSVVTCREDCVIRLMDKQSGDLFAECPVPNDAPLTTAVEPVVDSSRYFVLRVSDSQTRRHAFIGIGFRDRNQASDFNAALHEHLQYLRRAREAEQMREAFTAGPDAEGEGAGPAGSSRDLSLKPGETFTLNLAKAASSSAKLASTADRPPLKLATKLSGSPLLVPAINAVAGRDGGMVPILLQPPGDKPNSAPRRTLSNDSMRASVQGAQLMPVLSGHSSQLPRVEDDSAAEEADTPAASTWSADANHGHDGAPEAGPARSSSTANKGHAGGDRAAADPGPPNHGDAGKRLVPAQQDDWGDFVG